MPGDALDDLIAPFKWKGLTGEREYRGQRVNEFGETEHVYQVTNDPEWGEKDYAHETYEFEYSLWHQTYHKGVADPRCTICSAEARFRQERAPHDKYHKAQRRYDPSCRYCQDDKFFGRM